MVEGSTEAMNLFKPKRDWVLIDTQTLPSVLDRHKNGFSGEVTLRFAKGCAQRTLIQTFKCNLTGEIKVVRTRSGQKGVTNL